MVMDRQFRNAVKADASKALAGFGLDAGELEGFTHIDVADFDKTITGLDERVSKGMRIN
jgi:hypothetical protein